MAGVSTEDGRVEVPSPARDVPFAELFAKHYAPALRLAALSGVNFYPVPGVGVWAAVFGYDVGDPAGRIGFSADGSHWEERAPG